MSNSLPMDRRIHAIDAVRGFCLLNIFVNHVTLGVLHELSPSKLGFCDSADIFVFLAGVSAFLAYGGTSRGFQFGEARQRMWRRAMQLYAFNVGILAAAFAIITASDALAPMGGATLPPHAVMSSAGWLTYLWHVLTFQQSIGFSMVLRLYVFLLIVGPAYVWLAARRYWYPLVPAAILWLVAGHFGLAERDSLTGQALSMTFLPWNLVFAAGISLGAAIRARVELPSEPALRWSALAIVTGGSLLITLGGHVSADLFAWLEFRNDFFWTGISKTLQSPLRILYLGALAYVFIAYAKAPLVGLFHGLRADNMLCRLGRRSLEVFTFGAIFALVADNLLWLLNQTAGMALRSPAAFALELVLTSVGVAGMLWVASANEGRPQMVPARAAAE